MFIAFSRHLFKSVGPHIDRLNMDGKGKRIHVVETGLAGPDVSVFYDQELHRVFWTDPQNEEISSASVDGKHNGPKNIYILEIYVLANTVILHGQTFLHYDDTANIILCYNLIMKSFKHQC
jgi:hypothetical protein